MTVATHDRRDGDVDVVELTPAQFEAAKKKALHSVGLTYAQLERQARRGTFSSARVRKVWMAIGAYPT